MQSAKEETFADDGMSGWVGGREADVEVEGLVPAAWWKGGWMSMITEDECH